MVSNKSTKKKATIEQLLVQLEKLQRRKEPSVSKQEVANTLLGQLINHNGKTFEILTYDNQGDRFFCLSTSHYEAINFFYSTLIGGIIDGTIVLTEAEPILKTKRLKKYNTIVRSASARRKAYLKHCFDNAIAPRRWVPPSRLTKKEILDDRLYRRPIF